MCKQGLYAVCSESHHLCTCSAVQASADVFLNADKLLHSASIRTLSLTVTTTKPHTVDQRLYTCMYVHTYVHVHTYVCGRGLTVALVVWVDSSEISFQVLIDDKLVTSRCN